MLLVHKGRSEELRVERLEIESQEAARTIILALIKNQTAFLNTFLLRRGRNGGRTGDRNGGQNEGRNGCANFTT